MNKLLVVSPHFPPVNAADHHRVRLALPYLRGLGWEPTVLAVEPDSVEGAVLDPLLSATFPADIRVIRVRGLRPRAFGGFRLGGLWWRCGRALRRAGDRLLASEHFDAAFFSSTVFDSFKLGPRWLSRHRLPYVLDYQDPWINDYYDRTGAAPPGGRLKYAWNQFRARRAEPAVLRGAARVIAVSPAYARGLAAAYPWFDAGCVLILPFGAASVDWDVLKHHSPAQPLINFDDGFQHHVYVGRAGSDMAPALTILFRAFRRFQGSDPERAARLRFHFIGTNYAPPPLGRDWVVPIAQQEGVAAAVSEHRGRVGYFDALHYLSKAHALVVVGSDDPSYNASKLFPYALARRPTLLILGERSPAADFAARIDLGVRCLFGAGGEGIEARRRADEVWRIWFVEEGCACVRPFDEAAFAPFTAASLAAALASVFDGAAQTGG